MNFQTTCRICIRVNSGMVSIFDSYNFWAQKCVIFKAITACASVQIHKFDGFSEQICRRCLEHLAQAYSFKRLCEESDYKFRNCTTATDEVAMRPEFVELCSTIDNYDEVQNDLNPHEKSRITDLIKTEQRDVEIVTKNSDKIQGGIQEEVDVVRLTSGIFESVKCDESFGLKDSQCNSDSSFKCELCSKSFATKEYLDFHMKFHAGQQSVIKIKSEYVEEDTTINYGLHCEIEETTDFGLSEAKKDTPLMDRKKSGVWAYFHKVDAVSAECSQCSSILKCRGGSTSALRNHLKLKHKIVPKTTEERAEGEVPSAKRAKLAGNNESLGELLARCAARDGFSIRGITNSSAIREFVSKRNFAMPQSEATIRDLIVAFSEERKVELRETFSKLTELGQRFSLTIEEWRSVKSKRLLCLTVQANPEKYCLGLINIPRSCDSAKIEGLIKDKLLEFNLRLNKDFVASTDSYGDLESHSCYNQAIHLAVMDVFYKKNVCEHDDSSDSECESENEDLHDNFYIEEASYKKEHLFVDKVLERSRKIIKHLKSNPILQKYVFQQERKELPLLIDCRTRWNSLIPMLERFIKLKDCVKKALEDTDLYHEEDFITLQNILDALKPIELTVKELSKDSATLLSAEGVFKIVFERLQEINTDLSLKMYEALKKRILERRNQLLVSLHAYLQNGSLPTKPELPYAAEANTLSFARCTNTRLFMDSSKSTYVINPSTSSKGLTPEIQDSISLFLKGYSPEAVADCNAEFKTFESTGTRSRNLENLLQALNSIRPTTTSNRRVFSVENNFCTTVRSGMQYETLDALVFLKSYFLREK